MSNFKAIIGDAPRKAFAFVSSPKFAAALGVGVAIFQMAAALDQYMAASKEKQKIGFGKNKESNILDRLLGRDD